MEEINKLLEGAESAGPADEEMIRSAEAVLGIQFPQSYRAFLARYGAALCSGFELAGLFRNVNKDEPPLWTDVVTRTIQVRQASNGLIPNQYVPISDDGGDRAFYLDTGRLGPEGECPVIVLGPGDDARVVADDFLEFVVRAFNHTL